MTRAKGRPKGVRNCPQKLTDDSKCMIEYIMLRKARKELGLTIGNAASLCNVPIDVMSLWEQGLADPTYEELDMLEEMFGFDPGELIYCGSPQNRVKKRKDLEVKAKEIFM